MANHIIATTKKCLTRLTKNGRRLLHNKPNEFRLPDIAKEDRVKIGSQYIRYVTVGHGPHNVVCIPGALGTIWTDFRPQIEGFDGEKFTLVAFDLPGFGKSTPPQKTYSFNFHETDADIIHEFLKVRGLGEFSILGWCYGSIVAMIYAAKHPDKVTKLVLWAASSYISPQELESVEGLLDINLWSPAVMQPRVDVYGEQLLAKHWDDLFKAISRRYKEKKGDYCTALLPHIKCPTYVLHGAKDPLVDESHVTYLKDRIKYSRTYIYPHGHHNIHLRYAEDFNRRVQDFLLEE